MITPSYGSEYIVSDDESVLVLSGGDTGNSRLFKFVVAVLVLHLVMIFFVEFDDGSTRTSTLKVILERSVSKVEQALKEEAPVANEVLAEVEEQVVKPQVNDIKLEEEDPVLSEEVSTGVASPSASAATRAIEYHRIREIIREEQSRHSFSTEGENPRTFSTADFPSTEAKPGYYREAAIRTLVSAPRKVIRQDARGYTTILTDDGFGNVICMQERGFAGDGNPPLWYRIPASTCGHLK